MRRVMVVRATVLVSAVLPMISAIVLRQHYAVDCCSIKIRHCQQPADQRHDRSCLHAYYFGIGKYAAYKINIQRCCRIFICGFAESNPLLCFHFRLRGQNREAMLPLIPLQNFLGAFVLTGGSPRSSLQ
jgi:hypothetical protein